MYLNFNNLILNFKLFNKKNSYEWFIWIDNPYELYGLMIRQSVWVLPEKFHFFYWRGRISTRILITLLFITVGIGFNTKQPARRSSNQHPTTSKKTKQQQRPTEETIMCVRRNKEKRGKKKKQRNNERKRKKMKQKYSDAEEKESDSYGPCSFIY